MELQAALQAARTNKQAFDCKPIRVQFNGHPRPVVMHLRPAHRTGDDPVPDELVLVQFEERDPETEQASRRPSEDQNLRIQELESELRLARQRLQGMIEEHESSQEEMKASNEEMQSTNEELRSTLEELETSKEELQSVNEELQTVNQQNRHKVEELAQLTGDLQNLLAATDIATLFLDRDLRILRFTPKLGDLFNVRITDHGRPISDLTHRLGYSDLRTDAEAVLSRLVPIERELQDETGRWYLTRVAPYRSTSDRIEGVVITFVDIDTRKRAEDALRVSEERLRRMVNVDVVGILIFDESGTLIDCNDAWVTLSGYSTEEARAKKLTWRIITPPEYTETSEQEWRKLAETGHIGPYEKEVFRRDGSRNWMVFAGASLGDGTIVKYCMDISGRKRAEDRVRTGEHNLAIANSALTRVNEDLKHFSYAVSHDMQEPLRMLVSYTQLLERDYRSKLDEQGCKYIGYAVEGGRRMETLLNDLREYWSVVDEQKEEESGPIDCNRALEQAMAYLEAPIKESGAVITRDSLPTVIGEPYPLTVLFQNLISNGIKYHHSETPPRIHVSAQQSDGAWRFSVADNGIGIEAENLESVFLPFTRLREAEYPGTGLGLAMCRKVVERYHGRIWAESTHGKGSTFHFALPALGVKHDEKGQNRSD